MFGKLNDKTVTIVVKKPVTVLIELVIAHMAITYAGFWLNDQLKKNK